MCAVFSDSCRAGRGGRIVGSFVAFPAAAVGCGRRRAALSVLLVLLSVRQIRRGVCVALSILPFLSAADRGHAFEIAVAPAVTYRGDEYAVRQLCSILLDNACKYTAADAPIRFTPEKEKKGIVIRTENACDNISEQDTKMLFDRFYRADPSRNAATGGFGIGLSIARSIAEGHGGSIKAEKAAMT